MEWPEDMEIPMELPQNLQDKDISDRTLQQQITGSERAVFSAYSDMDRGIISGTESFSPVLACFKLTIQAQFIPDPHAVWIFLRV